MVNARVVKAKSENLERKNLKKEKILKAIEKFNEIRFPEANAELLKLEDKRFLIKFSGHMCFTCGAYDYFDDLKFELEDLKVKTKFKGFKRIDNDYFVNYQILNRLKSLK